MEQNHGSEGMSFRELIVEIRRDVKEVFAKIDHMETRLDTEVLTKTEFNLWKETQRNIRRYAITTIISLLVLGLMIGSTVVAVLDNRSG